MYARELETGSFIVLRAENGKEARIRLAEGKPDLILLDIVLPEESGVSILKDLKSKEKTATILVVAISAFGSEENKQKVLELGAVEFLEKDQVDPKDILKTVKKYVRS